MMYHVEKRQVTSPFEVPRSWLFAHASFFGRFTSDQEIKILAHSQKPNKKSVPLKSVNTSEL